MHEIAKGDGLIAEIYKHRTKDRWIIVQGMQTVNDDSVTCGEVVYDSDDSRLILQTLYECLERYRKGPKADDLRMDPVAEHLGYKDHSAVKRYYLSAHVRYDDGFELIINLGKDQECLTLRKHLIMTSPDVVRANEFGEYIDDFVTEDIKKTFAFAASYRDFSKDIS